MYNVKTLMDCETVYDVLALAEGHGKGEEFLDELGVSLYTNEEALAKAMYEAEDDGYLEMLIEEGGSVEDEEFKDRLVSTYFLEVQNSEKLFLTMGNPEILDDEHTVQEAKDSFIAAMGVEKSRDELKEALAEVRGDTPSPGLAEATSTQSQSQRATRTRIM